MAAVVLVVLGAVVVLALAFKLTKLLLKVVLFLVFLALLGGLGWWVLVALRR